MKAQRNNRHTPVSLRVRGVQLLSQREHSVHELRQKLLRHARLLEEAVVPVDANDRIVEAEVGRGNPHRAACSENNSDDGRSSSPMIHPLPPPSPTEAVDETLAWLQSQGYLSDTRFVQSRVHVRAARLGNLRIRQELAQHQVVLTPEAEGELRASELSRAQSVCERKFGSAAPATPGEAAKRARFLMQRGFSSEVVRRVLRAAGQAAGDE